LFREIVAASNQRQAVAPVLAFATAVNPHFNRAEIVVVPAEGAGDVSFAVDIDGDLQKEQGACTKRSAAASTPGARLSHCNGQMQARTAFTRSRIPPYSIGSPPQK